MDPFTLPDSADIGELLTNSAVRLLRRGGLQEFSVSAMARDLDMSRQALNDRFAAKYGARRRVLQLVVLTFGDRWLAWASGPLGADPPTIRLPEHQDEVTGVRVWAALHELARGEAHVGNPHLSDALAHIRAEEADLTSDALRRWTGVAPNTTQLYTLLSLADGMRRELALPSPRLSPAGATAVMTRAVAELGAVLGRRTVQTTTTHTRAA